MKSQKTQKIAKAKKKTSPIVQSHKEPKKPIGKPIPQGVDKPVRAVLYVEVGDMSSSQVRLLVSQIGREYHGAKGGVHYIVPIRNGRLSNEILFETEILEFVESVCEVVDGKIKLKNEIDVLVIRDRLN